jgi:alpha-ketoglutarate-dependent taurine dioxygenase
MSMVSERDAKADASSHAAPKFVPLTQHIGCEVKGVDLRDPLEPAAASAIYRAWLDHAVLVFRDQDLTQEDLIRVTGILASSDHSGGRSPHPAERICKNSAQHHADLEHPRERRDHRRAA